LIAAKKVNKIFVSQEWKKYRRKVSQFFLGKFSSELLQENSKKILLKKISPQNLYDHKMS